MNVRRDDALYARFAARFVPGYVEAIARTLARSEAARFDLGAVDARAADLLYELCFFGLAQVEGRAPEMGRARHDLQVALRRAGGPGEPPTLWIGGTALHGLIDDDMLAAGLARARGG